MKKLIPLFFIAFIIATLLSSCHEFFYSNDKKATLFSKPKQESITEYDKKGKIISYHTWTTVTVVCQNGDTLKNIICADGFEEDLHDKKLPRLIYIRFDQRYRDGFWQAISCVED